MPDPAWEMTQRVDRDASGKITVSEEVTDSAIRDRYIISSLIDEAITSSQLEGAAAPYRAAKDMIRSGRHPRDRNEQMIFSNYAGMKHVRELKELPFTPERILQLHRIITADTLDDPTAAGRVISRRRTLWKWRCYYDVARKFESDPYSAILPDDTVLRRDRKSPLPPTSGFAKLVRGRSERPSC